MESILHIFLYIYTNPALNLMSVYILMPCADEQAVFRRDKFPWQVYFLVWSTSFPALHVSLFLMCKELNIYLPSRPPFVCQNHRNSLVHARSYTRTCKFSKSWSAGMISFETRFLAKENLSIFCPTHDHNLSRKNCPSICITCVYSRRSVICGYAG